MTMFELLHKGRGIALFLRTFGFQKVFITATTFEDCLTLWEFIMMFLSGALSLTALAEAVKAVLLHNINQWFSIPLAHSIVYNCSLTVTQSSNKVMRT